MSRTQIWMTVALFLSPAPALGDVIRVPAERLTIQGALNAAVSGDTILVAPGTYRERIDFLGKDVTLRSDADGVPATRDIAPETTIIDGNQLGTVVKFRNGETAQAVLEGFTIRNGWGEEPDRFRAGGIDCDGASPTITHCIVTASQSVFGGGIAVRDASPAISHCTLHGNVAMPTGFIQGPGYGGGIHCEGSTLSLSDCIISGNTATGYMNLCGGGGIYAVNSSVTVTRCTVTGNTSYSAGSGIEGYASALTISESTVSDNLQVAGIASHHGGSLTLDGCTVADNGGGGVSLYDVHGDGASAITNSLICGNASTQGAGIHCHLAELTLTNTTVAGNTASSEGGGIACTGTDASVTVRNTIVWGNDAPTGPQIHLEESASAGVSYSDVEGGWPGTGNLDLDPLFVTGPFGGFYLSQTAAGQGAQSPCVDAGDPATEPWGWAEQTTRTDQAPDTGTVDMGYHHARVFCTDADGDGYAVEGGLCGEADCDDTRADVNPGMPEVPGNGLDDDCDPLTPSYPQQANTLAASHGRSSLIGSGVFNTLCLLLAPAALIVWARRRGRAA